MELMRQSRFLRQITDCDSIVGYGISDEKIRENNKINKITQDDPDYIPLSYETDLVIKYINKNCKYSNNKEIKNIKP